MASAKFVFKASKVDVHSKLSDEFVTNDPLTAASNPGLKVFILLNETIYRADIDASYLNKNGKGLVAFPAKTKARN